MPERTITPLPFPGFQRPHYTMVPDEVFDELLVELSGAELKALLYIIRRTFGFKRESDSISLSQMLTGITTKEGRVLDRGAGLSKPTLLQVLRSLQDKNIIEAERQSSQEKGNEPTLYRLKFASSADSGGSKNLIPPLDKKLYQGVGKETLPSPWSKNFTTQDTVLQNTDISNIRKENGGQQEKEGMYAETTIVLDEKPAISSGDGSTIGSANGRTPSQKRSPAGFTPLAATLDTRRRALPTVGSRERDAIFARIEQFAAEFGDRASLKSSASRACNLFMRSHLPQEQFIHCLWEARSITRERCENALRRGTPVKAKMGYFFSVLSERLGLDEAPPSSLSPDDSYASVPS